jgi:ubiquinone/menaquinone biosynthesis C-methylase UbiE
MSDQGVIGFYDTHPINEQEILTKLTARGDELKEFDQDNYSGPEGVELLAERANIRPEHHVLDVCSGMGGPARWLAYRIGCRVTGIDLTQSRVESAQRLTQRVGLASLVDFLQGDATAMALPDATYDSLISQEAWLHIPTKEKLISECARVVKEGGTIAFTDVTLRRPLTSADEIRLSEEMQLNRIASAEQYIELLQKPRCEILSHEDLSTAWADVLGNRLEMFRSLRNTTVARFGTAHFEKWDDMYSFYVGLFVSGKLGGVRIAARLTGSRP